MNLLYEILDRVPPEWDEACYQHNRYVLKNVDKRSAEFYDVDSYLNSVDYNYQILKLRRIQHPFAYGRFKIRKQHLKKRRQRKGEGRDYFYVTDKDKLDDILNHNCDARRGGVSKTFVGKPFFDVIVVRTLPSESSEADLYPEYLIKCRTFQDLSTVQYEEDDLSAYMSGLRF